MPSQSKLCHPEKRYFCQLVSCKDLRILTKLMLCDKTSASYQRNHFPSFKYKALKP